MSEQAAEQISGDPDSVGSGTAIPGAPDASSEPAAASMQEVVQEASAVESPGLVPEQGAAFEPTGMDAPKSEEPKLDAPNMDAPKTDSPKADAAVTSGKIKIGRASCRERVLVAV